MLYIIGGFEGYIGINHVECYLLMSSLVLKGLEGFETDSVFQSFFLGVPSKRKEKKGAFGCDLSSRKTDMDL
jgi:hypothetical protein